MRATIQVLLLVLAFVISGCASGKTPKYADVPGLCRAATLKEIEDQGWSLNPGRNALQVGAVPALAY